MNYLLVKNKNICFFYLENFIPPLPTTNINQWQHGTLSRDEAARVLRTFIKENLGNQVSFSVF